MINIKKYYRKARIDNFTLQELREIVNNNVSWRGLMSDLGYPSFGVNSKKVVIQRLDDYNISTTHFTYGSNKFKNDPNNVFIKNTTACPATVRKYFKNGNYVDYKCSICGLEPYWNSKELVLTLDHINGDNRNNELNNLHWICPNCDRQLDTYAGRNHKNKEANKKYCSCGEITSDKAEMCLKCHHISLRKVERPSREELKYLIRTESLTKVGKQFNVSVNSISNWCINYNLPSKKFEINKYSDEEWNKL